MYSALVLEDEQYSHHPTAFMRALLAPHVALFVLPLARTILPAKYFVEYDGAWINGGYKHVWILYFVAGGFTLARASAAAYSHGGLTGLLDAFWEQPAVSSVSFDVVFCWITWICWFRARGFVEDGDTESPTDRAKGT